MPRPKHQRNVCSCWACSPQVESKPPLPLPDLPQCLLILADGFPLPSIQAYTAQLQYLDCLVQEGCSGFLACRTLQQQQGSAVTPSAVLRQILGLVEQEHAAAGGSQKQSQPPSRSVQSMSLRLPSTLLNSVAFVQGPLYLQIEAPAWPLSHSQQACCRQRGCRRLCRGQ